jgi:hypothetical protein
MPRRSVICVAVAVLIVAATGFGSVRPLAGQSSPPLNPAFEGLVDRYLTEIRGVGGGTPNDMSAAALRGSSTCSGAC